jgi:hypothetical protein
MGVSMGRVWDGIVSGFRLVDRFLEIYFAVVLAGGACLWLAGSIHAGHFLNWDELSACREAAFDWITKGWQ